VLGGRRRGAAPRAPDLAGYAPLNGCALRRGGGGAVFLRVGSAVGFADDVERPFEVVPAKVAAPSFHRGLKDEVVSFLVGHLHPPCGGSRTLAWVVNQP
jgi:hypothetical protein